MQKAISQAGGIVAALATIDAYPTNPGVLAAASASLMNMAHNTDSKVWFNMVFDVVSLAAKCVYFS